MRKFCFKSRVSTYICLIIGAILVFEVFVVTIEAADETIVSVSPSSQTVTAYSDFSIEIFCTPGEPIKAFELDFSFDASMVQVNSVYEGDIFDGYNTYFNSGTINNNLGTVDDVYGLIMGPGNVTDSGSFVTIELSALDQLGVCNLDLENVGVTNEIEYVPVDVNSGTVDIISTLPEILNVDLTASEPLDTDSDFGWVQISCDVSDDDGIDMVYLNITNPDGSTNSVLMQGSGSYYYNTTTAFSDVGEYSYHVWAVDNVGAGNCSAEYDFSMPPNWDIDMDGACNVFDLTLLSNSYGETGGAGWIREDIDNNGEVEILDFVFVSTHYGEFW